MLFKRDLLDTIVRFLGGREIIVITGMRQVGKTSLIRLLLEKLDDCQAFFLDLEDFNLLDICDQGPDALVAYLKLLGADFSSRTVVAIDEIQYLKNPTNLLKLLHDHHPELKLIVSGSSSLEIRSKFKDSLAGRKAIFELDTLNFAEFLLFRDQRAASIKQNAGSLGDIIISGTLNEASGMAKNHLAIHLADYLIWGGFPGVTLHADALTKESMLRDIHTSYIRKDIKDIAAIEDISGYNRLLQLLAGQSGNLVNINELSATVGLSVNTVRKYLFLLEQTFIITLLRPYHSNQRKELTKMPKVYFNDIGLRNVAIGNLRRATTPDGVQVENFIFSELKKRFVPNETLFFWRTAGGAEVDFVIIHEGLPLPVEVKAADMKKPAISRSLRSFIDAFNPVRAIVVNASLCCTVRVDMTDVLFVPLFAV